MPACQLLQELTSEAMEALSRVVELSQRQVEALKNGDQTRLLQLDKELETAFGAKERSFGALIQHRSEHGC